MKKQLFCFIILSVCFSFFVPQAYSFEKLKYIGEIAIEKRLKPVDIALDDEGSFCLADVSTGKVVIYNKFGNIVGKKTIGKKKLFTRGGSLTIDNKGNLIVVDTASNKVYKVNREFTEIFAIGGTGYSESQFRTPTGLSIDKDNNFYVADSGNRRVQVFNLDGIFFGQIRSGEKETSRSSYKKNKNGEFKGSPELTLPYLGKPTKVSVDKDGKIYVLDSLSSSVHAYTSKGDPLFTISMKKLLRVKKITPIDMVVGNGKIFVLTKENIKVFDAEKGTYISNIGSKGKGRGQFYLPLAIEIIDNMVYILDSGNHRVQIMEYGEKQSSSVKVQRTLEEKTKIAIFDFKDSNALSKRKQFGETVSEMFITSCVNTENFLVVERKEIKRVLDELQFDLSDMVDIKTAKQVGKILGVDYGIVGSVAIFDDSIEIDVRFIGLETGIIVLAESKRASDEVNLRKSVNEIVGKIERIYVNQVGAPQAPGGFYSLGKIKSVYMRWDKTPEDNVASYKIYRSRTQDGEYELVGNTGTNEYNDKNLEEGAKYYYRVSILDPKGNESKLSEIIACKTREKPTFGHVLKVTSSVYVKQCKFSWKKADGDQLKEYRIYRSDSESGDYVYIGATTQTKFEDSGLEDGATYYYRVKKVLPNGQESQFSNAFSCKTNARPQIPLGVSAESGLARKVSLKWNKSKIDKDIRKYHIFRSEFPDGDFKQLKSVKYSKFTDIKLLDNKTYYYKIQAVDKHNLLSDFSEVFDATTKDIPSSPQSLSADSNLPRKVVLSWDKNPEKDITHYVVFRSNAHDGEYKKLGSSKTNEYVDTKLKDYTEYYYFIVAVDVDKLESKPSDTVSARTKPIPVTPANVKAIGNQPKMITIVWDKNPEDDIKTYHVFATKNPKKKFKRVGDTENNVFEYAKLKDNQTMYFKITAEDVDSLESMDSEIVSATTKPLPPTPMNVAAELQEGRIILSWTAIQYDDLFGYIIYKNKKKVEIIQENIFIDENIQPGKKYKYEVSTMDNDKLESPKGEKVVIKVPKE